VSGDPDPCHACGALPCDWAKSPMDLRNEIARLRAFIKSIEDDWIESKAEENDDWADGYEDCLAEYASRARVILTAEQVLA
jgi:hypothetical protein